MILSQIMILAEKTIRALPLVTEGVRVAINRHGLLCQSYEITYTLTNNTGVIVTDTLLLSHADISQALHDSGHFQLAIGMLNARTRTLCFSPIA